MRANGLLVLSRALTEGTTDCRQSKLRSCSSILPESTEAVAQSTSKTVERLLTVIAAAGANLRTLTCTPKFVRLFVRLHSHTDCGENCIVAYCGNFCFCDMQIDS